jgi:hypothetical protein
LCSLLAANYMQPSLSPKEISRPSRGMHDEGIDGSIG